jgi:4-amino-4-deoxy-L-arabinose transferase-like glycosyltransferase
MDRPPHGKAKGDNSKWVGGGIIALIVIAGMLLGVAAASPVALVVVLRDGAKAGSIVLAATGLGLGLLRVSRLGECPPRWRLLAAAGLGLGATALLVLGLGVLGILYRGVWIGLLIVFAAVGLLQLRSIKWRNGDGSEGGDDKAWMKWLWLGAMAFGALALLAGTMPPGTLWPEEGNGYDVLEYHLGVPREYLEAGRVSYLPHNIYSNFPFNVEMLYLLAMVLHGEAVGAALTANLLNVMLGMLAVAAVWLAGREYGRGSGVIAGLMAASCPFIVYLSGVAYVENGMLMFAALGVAAMLRAGRLPSRKDARSLVEETAPASSRCHTDGRISQHHTSRWAGGCRWAALAGVFAGLACGCKYTAIPAVLVPLGLASLGCGLARRPRNPALPVVFLLAATVTFAPWLIKNVVMTGNPVFPLARGVFGERAGVWNDDGAARWHEGHLPAPEDRPWPRRLGRLWSEVLGSKLFGPVLVLALVAGGIGGLRQCGRRLIIHGGSAPALSRCHTPSDHPRAGGSAELVEEAGWGTVFDSCWLMLIIGIAAWTGWTHLQGRFSIALIVPAAVIVGRFWQSLRQSTTRAIGLAIIIGALAVNGYTAHMLLAGGPVSFLQVGVFGRTDVVTDDQHLSKLNGLLAKGEKILMVGDARRFYLGRGADYCVVFNRNPFAEAAASLSPEGLMEWLRLHQYRWVYVDWIEMHRLRTTRYGFWASVDKELFGRLTAVGLRPVEDFEIPGRRTKYATLFEVVRSDQTEGPR